MGKLTGGILGNIKGKVGAVVGSVNGGQNIIKSMPASYADKKSDTQLAQRSAFSKCLVLFQFLNAVVFEGFKEKLAIHSGYNAFMSANVNSGVTAAGPVWNALKVAKGSLGNPNFVMHTGAVDSKIDFSWTDDSDGSSKLATDKVVCVAINPLTNEVATLNTPITRADEEASLTLPATMQGVALQTYAFVVRADGKKASTSKYTGTGTGGSDLAGSVQ
jgi:hypothetical protein